MLLLTTAIQRKREIPKVSSVGCFTFAVVRGLEEIA
jgi:hypothetical protein